MIYFWSVEILCDSLIFTCSEDAQTWRHLPTYSLCHLVPLHNYFVAFTESSHYSIDLRMKGLDFSSQFIGRSWISASWVLTWVSVTLYKMKITIFTVEEDKYNHILLKPLITDYLNATPFRESSWYSHASIPYLYINFYHCIYHTVSFGLYHMVTITDGLVSCS